jgi:putative transposase
VSKNLRLKSFQPEKEYVYLTYSLKNDKKEETKILLENYRVLLQKALDYLWEKTRIERKEVKKGKKAFTKVKVKLPKKKEVYKALRNELEKVNNLGVFSCSHLIRYIIVKLYQIFSNIQYSPQVSLVQGSLIP